MNHPIKDEDQLALRKKLTILLKSSYDLVRQDTIVFVCGGNEPDHARTRFLAVAPAELGEYDLFTPELALKYQSRASDGPFDLTKFEELVAEISVAVVVFPESPGSFCETGYFTAKDDINRKTLLAINKKYQGEDSFISTGPLHRVNEKSDFREAEFIDYAGDFSQIIRKIKKRRPNRYKKAIKVKKYADLSFVEKMGIIQKSVDVLRMATADDIVYIMRSAFHAQTSEREIRELVAILLGSKYFL